MKSAASVMASRPQLRRCVKEKRSGRGTRQIPRLDQPLPSLFRIIAASFPSSHRTNLPTTAAAVATRKNARVRMLPAKKEEGLGRSSECWERHTAKHPAIPSECNMHIHRYITTRLVSEQVIHMFGAVLWVAKVGGRLASPNLFAIVLTNIPAAATITARAA